MKDCNVSALFLTRVMARRVDLETKGASVEGVAVGVSFWFLGSLKIGGVLQCLHFEES